MDEDAPVTTASLRYILSILPKPETTPASILCGVEALGEIQSYFKEPVFSVAGLIGLPIYRDLNLEPNAVQIVNCMGVPLQRFLLKISNKNKLDIVLP